MSTSTTYQVNYNLAVNIGNSLGQITKFQEGITKLTSGTSRRIHGFTKKIGELNAAIAKINGKPLTIDTSESTRRLGKVANGLVQIERRMAMFNQKPLTINTTQCTHKLGKVVSALVQIERHIDTINGKTIAPKTKQSGKQQGAGTQVATPPAAVGVGGSGKSGKTTKKTAVKVPKTPKSVVTSPPVIAPPPVIPAPAPPPVAAAPTAAKTSKSNVRRMPGGYTYPSNVAYKALGPTPLPDNGGMAIDMLKGMGIAYGIAGLGSLVSSVVQQAVEYDNMIKTVENILKAHDEKGNFSSRFSSMTQTVRRVGMETKFKVTEVADAAKFLAMAGLDVEAIEKAIRPIADVALVGDTELGMTADLVTNIMTAYNIAPDRMRMAADIMTNTFTMSNTTLTEIAEAYKYAASLLSAGGVGFEEATAAIGVLGDAGIKGSQAGTTMRTIMANLVNPTKKQKAAWSAVGVNRYDSSGNLKDPIEIFKELNAKNLEVADYYRLFHKTAASGAVALASHVDKWDTVMIENYLSAGLSSQLANEKKNTLQGLWAQLVSVFVDTGVDAFNGIQNQLRGIIGNVIEWMKKPEFKKGLITVADALMEFIHLMITASKWFMDIASWFGPIIKVWMKFQLLIWPIVKTFKMISTIFVGVSGIGTVASTINNFIASLFKLGGAATNVANTTASAAAKMMASSGLPTSRMLGYTPQPASRRVVVGAGSPVGPFTVTPGGTVFTNGAAVPAFWPMMRVGNVSGKRGMSPFMGASSGRRFYVAPNGVVNPYLPFPFAQHPLALPAPKPVKGLLPYIPQSSQPSFYSTPNGIISRNRFLYNPIPENMALVPSTGNGKRGMSPFMGASSGRRFYADSKGLVYAYSPIPANMSMVPYGAPGTRDRSAFFANLRYRMKLFGAEHFGGFFGNLKGKMAAGWQSIPQTFRNLKEKIRSRFNPSYVPTGYYVAPDGSITNRLPIPANRALVPVGAAFDNPKTSFMGNLRKSLGKIDMGKYSGYAGEFKRRISAHMKPAIQSLGQFRQNLHTRFAQINLGQYITKLSTFRQNLVTQMQSGIHALGTYGTRLSNGFKQISVINPNGPIGKSMSWLSNANQAVKLRFGALKNNIKANIGKLAQPTAMLGSTALSIAAMNSFAREDGNAGDTWAGVFWGAGALMAMIPGWGLVAGAIAGVVGGIVKYIGAISHAKDATQELAQLNSAWSVKEGVLVNENATGIVKWLQVMWQKHHDIREELELRIKRQRELLGLEEKYTADSGNISTSVFEEQYALADKGGSHVGTGPLKELFEDTQRLASGLGIKLSGTPGLGEMTFEIPGIGGAKAQSGSVRAYDSKAGNLALIQEALKGSYSEQIIADFEHQVNKILLSGAGDKALQLAQLQQDFEKRYGPEVWKGYSLKLKGNKWEGYGKNGELKKNRLFNEVLYLNLASRFGDASGLANKYREFEAAKKANSDNLFDKFRDLYDLTEERGIGLHDIGTTAWLEQLGYKNGTFVGRESADVALGLINEYYVKLKKFGLTGSENPKFQRVTNQLEAFKNQIEWYRAVDDQYQQSNGDMKVLTEYAQKNNLYKGFRYGDYVWGGKGWTESPLEELQTLADSDSTWGIGYQLGNGLVKGITDAIKGMFTPQGVGTEGNEQVTGSCPLLESLGVLAQQSWLPSFEIFGFNFGANAASKFSSGYNNSFFSWLGGSGFFDDVPAGAPFLPNVTAGQADSWQKKYVRDNKKGLPKAPKIPGVKNSLSGDLNEDGTDSDELFDTANNKTGHGRGTSSSDYKSHQKERAIPKQININIGNLMNVDKIDMSNPEHAAVIANIKREVAYALVEAASDGVTMLNNLATS